MKDLHLSIATVAGVILLAGCSAREQPLSAHVTQAESTDTVGVATGSQTASAMGNLAAARRLAWDAAVLVQHPPHPVDTWQAAKVKWRQAIRLLEAIPGNTAVSEEAKEKLAVYQVNYTAISDRLTAEETAKEKLQAAQNAAWQAAVIVQSPPHALKVWQRASHKWEEAITLLESIPPTTQVYQQNQAKLATYRSNYSAINQRIATETKALLTLKQFSAVAARLNSLPDNGYLSDLTLEQIGVNYEDYVKLVQELQTAFQEFDRQPDAKRHPIYPTLTAAMDDYQRVATLWKTYLDFKMDNTQWLYDDLFEQMVPVSLQEVSTLVQKYGVKTYSGGTKVSLKLCAQAIWQKAGQRLRGAQQKMLSLN